MGFFKKKLNKNHTFYRNIRKFSKYKIYLGWPIQIIFFLQNHLNYSLIKLFLIYICGSFGNSITSIIYILFSRINEVVGEMKMKGNLNRYSKSP